MNFADLSGDLAHLGPKFDDPEPVREPLPAERDPLRHVGILALLVLCGLVLLGLRLLMMTHVEPPPPPPVEAPAPPPAPVEIPELRERNPEFAAWAGFGKGSFVDFEVVTATTRSITRTKIAAIQSCLKKGKLTISISSVSALGKSTNGYLYD